MKIEEEPRKKKERRGGSLSRKRGPGGGLEELEFRGMCDFCKQSKGTRSL